MSSWKHTLNWLPYRAKKKFEQALVDRKQGCSRVGNFGFNNEFQKYLHWDIRFVFLLHNRFKFSFECLHNLLLHARAKWQWWKEKPSLRLSSHGTGWIFHWWKIRAFGRFVHMEPRQTWTSKRSKFGRISVGAVNNLTATMWTPLTSKFLYGGGVAA